MQDSGKTSKNKFIRVWSSLDVEEVKKYLLLIDDLYGTCANCKQLGLNYLKDNTCPGCKTKFKYIATNQKSPSDIAKIAQRIHSESLSFTLIDRDDYNKSLAFDAAKDLFKS